MTDPDTRLESRYESVPAGGALGQIVDRLYAFHERHAGPVWHRGLPGSALTFIIGVGSTVDVTMPGRGPSVRHRAFVGGLHTEAALIHHDGFQRGVQLALRPEVAHRLLGVPAGALVGQLVELDAIVGDRVATRLVERVGEAEDLGDAARSVARELVEMLAASGRHPMAPPVAAALAQLRRTQGRVPIARVADNLGWSRRHLSRQVRDEVGLPPKVLARLFRFEQTLDALYATASLHSPDCADAGTTGEGMAAVAARLGYADQAHLSREVHRLSGATPTELLLERAVGGSLPTRADGTSHFDKTAIGTTA